MKGTTILLLGAATLVAYTSAHPYTAIPDGTLREDGYHYKKSTSNSNSNSYSQSNQEDADIDGSFGGKTFSGNKASGFSTSGSSHSQSSSFSSGSFNGNVPLTLIGGGKLPGLSEQSNEGFYGQFGSGIPGNPGTAGLGLGENGAAVAAGSSSYGGTESNAGGIFGVKGTKGAHGATSAGSSGSYDAAGSIESGSFSGSAQPIGGSFGSSFGQVGGTQGSSSLGAGGFASSSNSGAGQLGNGQGGVQYWWNRDDSPFQPDGKPSGGCTPNGCVLSGTFDLTKGSGGAEAANDAGQVNVILNGGNPFFAQGGASSGSFGTGGSSGSFGTSGSSGSFGSSGGSGSFGSSGSSGSFGSSGSSGSFGSSGNSGSYGSSGNSGSYGSTGPIAGAGSIVKPAVIGAGNPFFNGGYVSGSTASNGGKFNAAGSSSFATANANADASGIGASTGIIGAGNPFLQPGAFGSTGFIGSELPSSTPGYDGVSSIAPGNVIIGSSNPFLKEGGINPITVTQSSIGTIKPTAFPSLDFSTAQPSGIPSLSFSTPRPTELPSLSFSTPRPTELPSLSFSTPRPTEIPSLSFSTPRPTELPNFGFSTPQPPSVFSSTSLPSVVPFGPQQPSVSFAENPFFKPNFAVGTSTIRYTPAIVFGSTGGGDYQGNVDQQIDQQIDQHIDQQFVVPEQQPQYYPSTPAPFDTGSAFTVSCSGPGRICVLKSLCQNGLVAKSNGLEQIGNRPQQCNVAREVCCTIVPSLGIPSQASGSGAASASSSATANADSSSGTFGTSFGKPTLSTSNVNYGQQEQSTGSGNFGESAFSGSYDQSAQAGFGGSYDQSQQSFGIGQTGSVGSNKDNSAFGFAAGNSNANAKADANAAASIGFGNVDQQKKTTDGGLFGSSGDISTEDLSSGEPGSFEGANGYLPPLGSAPSDQVPAFSQPPKKDEPTKNVPSVKIPPRQPTPFPPAPETPIQVGCAAALICVEERFCTLEGSISPEPVALSSEQILRRVPLSSCKNPDNGVIGKCCRDPNYVDPWPMGNLPADYAGGFDEQGFPKYLNLGKSTTKRPPVRQPIITGSSSQNTKTVVRGPSSPQKQFPNFPSFPNFGQLFGGGSQTPTGTTPGTVSDEEQATKPTETKPPSVQIPSISFQNPFESIPNLFQDLPNPFEGIQNQVVSISNQFTNFSGFPGLPSIPTQISQIPGFPTPQTPGSIDISQIAGVIPSTPISQIPGLPNVSSFPPIPGLPINSGLSPSDSSSPTPEESRPTPSSERAYYDSASSNESPTFIAPHTPGLTCGLRNKVQRPSGLSNEDVAFGEIPWQAMILSTRDRKLLCSGVIVSRNAILTSARCVDGLRPEEVSIKTGEWKLGYELKHEEPLPFEIIQVDNIVPHPGYKSNLPSHDLALLFLEHPITLDQHVDIICIGDRPQPKLDRKCIATGWGKTVLQVNIAGSLMHSIDVDLLTQDECEERIKGAESPIAIDNTLVCAKASYPNNNLCQVDVGGPLACDKGNGFYELTGLYSQDTGCLPTNQVATFSLIDTNWLKQNIASPPQLRGQATYQVPNLIYGTKTPNSVKTIFKGSLKTEPQCDCQKSNLPPNGNRYLPPL